MSCTTGCIDPCLPPCPPECNCTTNDIVYNGVNDTCIGIIYNSKLTDVITKLRTFAKNRLFDVAPSQSIKTTPLPTTCNKTTKLDVIISPDSGNGITLHSNGLYSPISETPPAQIIVTADNGLTKTTNNIQLGGNLLHDTDVQSLNYQLNLLTNSSHFNISNAFYYFSIISGTATTDLESRFVIRPTGLVLQVATIGNKDLLAYYTNNYISSQSNESVIGSYYPTSDDVSLSKPAYDTENTAFVKTKKDGGDGKGLVEIYGKNVQIDSIPSSKNDTATFVQNNILYTNSVGKICSAPFTSVSVGAQNGLNSSVSPGYVELGGTITKNTIIDCTSDAVNNALILTGTHQFNTSDYGTFNSILKLSDYIAGHSASGNYEFANAGQIVISPTTDVPFRTNPVSFYTGIYGAAIKNTSFNTTNNVLSGGFFACYAADSGNINSLASIRASGLLVPPTIFGSPFTGTVTNYYGILVENVGTTTYASTITNKFGIYIKGTTAQNVVNVAEAAFTTPSDERIKSNIKESSYGLKEIELLRTVEYTYKTGNNKKQIGFIAQEVESVIPEAVKEMDLTELYDINDFKLLDKEIIFSVMVNAIKELSSKIKQLEAKINN